MVYYLAAPVTPRLWEAADTAACMVVIPIIHRREDKADKEDR